MSVQSTDEAPPATDDVPPAEKDASTVFQLGYASAATSELGSAELSELLAIARTNNSSVNVTGMLLYHNGSFIQILEGERSTVEALYERIVRDPRHSNAMLLFRGEADRRCFDHWTMGFHRLEVDAAEAPPGLNRFLENGVSGISAADGERIKEVLLGFREGKWRRTVSH